MLTRFVATRIALALLLALVVFGCANTYVIPDSGDPDQRGIRFYLPRPYVTVLRPYPVAENTWVVPGKIAPDGLILGTSELPEELKPFIFTDAGVDAANAPFLMISGGGIGGDGDGKITATSGDGDGTSDGEKPEAGESGSTPFDKLIEQVVNAGTDVNTSDAPSGGTASAWIKKGDLAEFRDPVNDLFEIRYLPDMNQRYVLVGEAGLGSAEIDAYLTRAMLAHHYGKSVDRSDLGRMVFGNAQAVIDIVRAAGKTALVASTGGIGAVPIAAEAITATSGAEAPTEPRDAMLRFTVVEYAVPGVYPILSQAEIDGLEVEGSFQQPVSAALPVAYRTTKLLIVSVLRDGDAPSMEGIGKSISTTPTDLKQEVREIVGEVLSGENIPMDHVKLEFKPGTNPPVDLVVTVSPTAEFNGDWSAIFKKLALRLGKTETFPNANRVRLADGNSP